MTVSYVTLYLPGSSQGMQVVEGGQLHLIYVSMGANSIPSAPGQTVRKDPFPQYVDDDELAAALAGVGGGGGAVASVNGQTGAVVLAADDIGGLATVATTGDYGDLTGKPTIPAAYTDEQVRDVIGAALVAGTNVTITPNDGADTITIAAAGGTAWLDAKLDFGAVGNDSADDTAALDAAVAAAKAQNRPLYIPAGTYRRTTPWDLRANHLVVLGDGHFRTIIRPPDNTAGVLLGGWWQRIEGLGVRYATPQPATNTGAVAFSFYKCGWGTYRSLSAEYVAAGFDTPQVNYDDGDTTTGNYGAFSCVIENLYVTSYSVRGFRLDAFNSGFTQNMLRNIYIKNNGTGSIATATQPGFTLRNGGGSVIEGLNLEWSDYAANEGALFIENCDTVVINGLHFEQVELDAWQAALVRVSFQSRVTINGLSVVWSRFIGSNVNDTKSIVGCFGPASVAVMGLALQDLTVSGGGFAMYRSLTVGATDCEARFVNGQGSGTPFTTLSVGDTNVIPGLRQVNDQVYAWRNGGGKTVLSGTAAPTAGTWARGDKVWNTAPAAAGAPGWVCTTAGTPGTWKAMASLAA